MPTLLLTGFEAFHTHSVNPSAVAAAALHGEDASGFHIEAALLPVEPKAACARVAALIAQVRPDAALLTGLASGRPQVTLERVAVNVMDFRIPDNAGQVYRDAPVIPGGPDACLSTLPLREILNAWRGAAVPGHLSDTAGTYVCNAVMYAALHELRTLGRAGVPCGFLHLPANAEVALAEAKPTPYLPQPEITRAVQMAARAIMARLDPAAPHGPARQPHPPVV